MGDIFDIPPGEIERMGLENSIYGFPLQKSVERLGDILISLLPRFQIRHPVGIDLGCGDGAVSRVLHKKMGCRWDGVELSAHRLDLAPDDAGVASTADADADEGAGSGESMVDLFEGDLLELSYKPYNLIYCNNVCFDEELTRKLELKILAEFTGLYVSFKKVVDLQLLRGSVLVESLEIQTNWVNDHVIHVYYVGDIR
jgi:hypothetical protein